MPARSCQCPERRAPIASRRWEVCSKPGDGTTVIRCKACGAIWTTRAKFAEALPYDIGPVTLPRDAFQHTRAIVALTMLDALLYQFRSFVEDQPKVLRHLDEMREIIEACGKPIRKRRTSAGARRDLHAACDAMYQSYRFPADPSEKVDRWAALFCAADLMSAAPPDCARTTPARRTGGSCAGCQTNGLRG